jgi:hypothetical protein
LPRVNVKTWVVITLLALAAAAPAAAADDLTTLSTRGTPVRLTHREARMLRPIVIERAWQLTVRRGIAFYRLEASNGTTCWATGIGRSVARLGSLGCTRAGFPSKRSPINDYSGFGQERGEPRMQLFRLVGFAADGVAEIRLLGHRNAVFARVKVESNTYVLLKPPRGVRAIVAVAEDGKLVYRRDLHLRRVPVPPTRPLAPPVRKSPALPPRPSEAPLQHGYGDGVTVDVYGNGLVFFRIDHGSRAEHFLRGANVNPGCFKLGHWRGAWEPDAVGVTQGFARELSIRLDAGMVVIKPPFAACTIRGTYGRRWGDSHGYRNAAEIPFTAQATRYFEEQAAARELAYFARSPVLVAVRKSLRHGGTVPSAKAIAMRVGANVVAVPSPHTRAGSGSIAVWTNGRDALVASHWTSHGKRLYVTIRGGKIARHNLTGLAFVF